MLNDSSIIKRIEKLKQFKRIQEISISTLKQIKSDVCQVISNGIQKTPIPIQIQIQKFRVMKLLHLKMIHFWHQPTIYLEKYCLLFFDLITIFLFFPNMYFLIEA